MYCESENSYFSLLYLNMDISLIMALICLRICVFIAEICMEGSVSQNVDSGLSFYFMLCR